MKRDGTPMPIYPEYFVIYTLLESEQLKRLVFAQRDYHLDGSLPDFSDDIELRVAFNLIRKLMDKHSSSEQ